MGAHGGRLARCPPEIPGECTVITGSMPENTAKTDAGAVWVSDDSITTWEHACLNSDSMSDHRGWDGNLGCMNLRSSA